MLRIGGAELLPVGTRPTRSSLERWHEIQWVALVVFLLLQKNNSLCRYGQVLWIILVYLRTLLESFEFGRGFTQGLFHPIKAIKWLFYRILTRKVWAWYKKLLNAMVRLCYHHRSAGYLFFGEWCPS